jgi:hypothetical protein
MIVIGVSLILASCQNIFSQFAQTTDQELLFKAQTQVNQSQWTDAISTISQMSTSFQNERTVLDLQSSAYAGRCGLNFLNLIQDLSNIGSTRLLLFLMQTFDGGQSSQISDCEQAETIIKSIAPIADLTTDENIYLMLLSFAKIGVLLSARADTNDDDIPDTSFHACDSSSLSDADAGQVAVSLSDAITALTAISSSVSVGSSQLAEVNTLCTQLSADASSYDFCGVTSTSALTASQLLGVRSVIQEGQYIGLGTCNNTLANCICQ